ncbi:ABC transporter permease [Nonomuraea indica]|uniref:ABC transporter permease n=1 Tax=Nonomuraea indica TaxID=1581193 RepID=A0ABW8ABD0_9ACTN
MRAVVASELLKLRSVTTTYRAIGVAALMVVLGAVWTFYVGTMADERGSIRAAAPEQGFLPLLQTSLALLGVLAITSELATGMVRTSLVVVPRRGVLFAAKAGVVGAVTFVGAVTILLTTYATSRLIAGDRLLGFNQSSLAADLPMLLASGLSVTVLALVGLGLGYATRSTAAGIVSVVSLLFVLPGIATYLPPPWNTQVASFMLPNLVPQIAGDQLSRRLGDGLLPPWAALATLIFYAAVTLGTAFYLFKRRDA